MLIATLLRELPTAEAARSSLGSAISALIHSHPTFFKIFLALLGALLILKVYRLVSPMLAPFRALRWERRYDPASYSCCLYSAITIFTAAGIAAI